MRCEKHAADSSSTVGVCGSCLRERLFALIAAQAQAQIHYKAQQQIQCDSMSEPLRFPRSVSPYITRRKSDLTPNWQQFQHNSSLGGISDHQRRFFSTPQVVGPKTAAPSDHKNKKKKNSTFSLFSGLFRSKYKRSDPVSDPDSRVPNYKHHYPASSSSSWFSTILSGRRKKQSRTFSLDESTISPARYSTTEVDNCGGDESPAKTPAADKSGRVGKSGHSRSLSGFGFCLSPLVRASPSRQWNHQKGTPQPEMVFPGDTTVPAKPHHLSNVTSFCKNRSRKIADFGRFNSHRWLSKGR